MNKKVTNTFRDINKFVRGLLITADPSNKSAKVARTFFDFSKKFLQKNIPRGNLFATPLKKIKSSPN